ncbi:MAG: RNA polymerase sigma factor [bacterium]
MSRELGDLSDWIGRYTPQLLGVAQAFARDADEAEDLLQELWIAAHDKARQRSSDTPVSAWLHAILLNIGRARYRRRRRRERLFAMWAGGGREHDGTHPPDISGALLRAQLWRDVANLPGLQRRVLLLRIIEDMSTAQTAHALGVAEGTIKASLHRALRTLRRALDPAPVAVRSADTPPLTDEEFAK